MKQYCRTAFLIFLLMSSGAYGGEYEDHLNTSGGSQYVQTWEDKKRLGLFAALFDMAQKRENPAGTIPKILHFIWLGNKPFPETSVAHVKGWIDRHPGWKVKFWTDLGHPVPDDRMEVHVFDAFPLQELKEYYHRADNYGGRSKLLCYAILLNEGGVYIDHDTQCIKPLDPIQESYDFFCGLEPLGPSVLSTSVFPYPHLLGSSAQHPILAAAKKWLISQWDLIEAQYPGTDPSSIYNRMQHRAVWALSVGFKEAHCKAGRKDVVFPPNYFSLSDRKKALYATHEHAGSWFKKAPEAELKMQKLFSHVAEEVNNTFLFALGLTAANIALGAFLFFRIRRMKRGRA